MATVKSQKSFTLVELLVAVTIFSLISTISTGILVSSLRAQKKLLASQELSDQVSFLIEYMSRTIRMAKKDLSGDCLTTAGAKYNYETNEAGRDRIRFLNYQQKCQEFFLEGLILKERKSTDSSAANFQSPSPLTSANLQVNLFKIGPSDSWDQNDNDQPRVTFSLGIFGKEQTKIKIQTTISQRNPDIGN